MKKFIYAVLLALAVSLSFYSCTEEQIKPSAGGTAQEPIIK